MARPLPSLPLGVYVHFPFCSRLCPYCDFAVAVRREIPHGPYLEGCLRELERRAGEYPGRRLVSIYFGGGTPGLWRPECLGAMIQAIQARWEPAGPIEITVEANPEHVTLPQLQALREVGVNRLSLGVQSFDDGTLRALGRAHTGGQARDAIEAARRVGFERLSFDLIFCAPGQTARGWAEELDVASSLEGPDHTSLYQLTIEERTVFGRRRARGRLGEVDPEQAADFYEAAAEVLGGAGYRHYEVSSWARPGGESRHNQLYWCGAEYLGVGVGAHSLTFSQGWAVRRANPRRLKEWLADPGGEGCEIERLGERSHLGERLMTGLRTSDGIDLALLQGCLDLNVEAAVGEELRRLEQEGLVLRQGTILRPTPTGLRLADRVAERVVGPDP